MNAPPDLRHVVGQWVAAADEDLAAAEVLASDKTRQTLRTASFHAQQCAEKYLKALLTALSVSFPKTHDLTELAAQAKLSLGIGIPELARLNRYAVETRYPGDWDPVTLVDVEDAISTARHIKSAVRAKLPQDVL